MIPSDLIKKVRMLEIKMRHRVSSTFSGEYHSIFKGKGINFAELRTYQAGDDVRSIDWNVTAKTGVPYVKLFEEERELTAIIMLDVSASGMFGSGKKTKTEAAAEIAAVLGFSAANNQDKVGLLLFSDKIERFIPPKKGKKHVFRLLREIFSFDQRGKGTSIQFALDFLLKVVKKRAIIFIISDFMDDHYELSLKLTAKKHDLVPIVIEDPRETSLPKAGFLSIVDPENGSQMMINTYSQETRKKFKNIVMARKMEIHRLFKNSKLSYITINIQKAFLDTLAIFFKKQIKKNWG